MIALPNLDGSFNATLFFPYEGDKSFAALKTPEAVTAFFGATFPDVVPLMPQLTDEFLTTPPVRWLPSAASRGPTTTRCCCSAMRRTPSCPSTGRA
ncbi:MAG: hypothetical protein WKG07_22675 [Hymenobacter sp.]